MPTADGPSLDSVARAATDAIEQLEERLAHLVSAVDRIKSDIDATRSHVQREREELDIEYSLATGSQYVIASPDSAELRRREKELTIEALRAGSMHRQFSEFMTFIGASVRQFSSDGELLGMDAATQAAVRSAAIATQETERHRLAREIHDGPAQALANAIIGLEFVERAIRGSDGSVTRPLEEVERIKSALREGLTEIRRFIFDLRPTMLQDRGLVATVEHYIQTYQSLFPMAIDLDAGGIAPALSAEQELTAFRVIQESIQNARKHARASSIVVRLTEEQGQFCVTIADDGRGFSPERVTTHMMGGAGLRGMEERAALVGGSIEIDSAPGEGTTITLTVPVSGHTERSSAAESPAARAADGEIDGGAYSNHSGAA